MNAPMAIEALALTKIYRSGHIFRRDTGVLAVDNVALKIPKGESHALVGESGCGKTTLARLLLGLEQPTVGRILISGEDINAQGKAARKALRRKMQVIFQDPYNSLDPRMSVEAILSEPLAIHSVFKTKAERVAKVRALLESVGLSTEHAGRYPHEFSGGQKQRIGIARALALSPEILIADEPVSALDVSVQAQILNLLKDLIGQYKLTCLFISHDLATVRFLCNTVSVMYMGRIVESAPVSTIFSDARHPYTRALIDSVPVPYPDGTKTIAAGPAAEKTERHKPADSCCRFAPRCRYAENICATQTPELQETAPNHFCACHILLLTQNPNRS